MRNGRNGRPAAEAIARIEADAGGILAYNQLAGEPIAGLDEERPLVVRTNDSRFTLGNLMRAQLYGVFATLSLGMSVLDEEGVRRRHVVPVDKIRFLSGRRRVAAARSRKNR